MAAKKKNTGLLIVGGVVLVGTVIWLTRKPAAPPTSAPPVLLPPAPMPSTSLPGWLGQGIDALSKLFGGGTGSLYAPYTPTTIAPPTAPAGSPASGIPYINPTTPGIPITAPTTGTPDEGDFWNYL